MKSAKTFVAELTEPKVSVVVLNWNGRELLRECLESLKKSEYPLYEIIVADNGSSDGSQKMVAERFSDIVLVENGENLGVPEGKNRGLTRAMQKDVQYIYTLDNDLIIEPKTIAESVRLMEANPAFGCTGSIIYDYEKRNMIQTAGNYVDWTQNLVSSRGARQRDTGQLEECAEVDYVGAGAMLTRRTAFEKVGLLDPGFYGYGYEDADFGLRVKRAGYKVVCYTRSKVWHRPFSGIGAYSFKKKYLESKNAIRFLRIYGDRASWAKFSFYAVAGLCYAAVREGIRGNIMGVIGKARGLYDGLRRKEHFARKLLKKEY